MLVSYGVGAIVWMHLILGETMAACGLRETGGICNLMTTLGAIRDQAPHLPLLSLQKGSAPPSQLEESNASAQPSAPGLTLQRAARGSVILHSRRRCDLRRRRRLRGHPSARTNPGDGMGGAGTASGPEDGISPRPLLLAGVENTPHRPPSAKAKGRRTAGKRPYGFRSRYSRTNSRSVSSSHQSPSTKSRPICVT